MKTGDRNYCLLHLHIPKTAGQSLLDYIYAFHSTTIENRYFVGENGNLKDGIYYYPRGIPEDSYPKGWNYHDPVIPPDKVIRAIQNRDVRVVSGHYCFGIHKYISANYKYITLLREPLTRILSLYRFLRQVKKDPLMYDRITGKEIDLKTFVTERDYTQVDNGQTRRLSGVEPPFGKCNRGMLEIAKQNLSASQMTFGILERFKDSIDLFANEFDWTLSPDWNLALPKRNVNRLRSSPCEIDGIMIDVVKEVNLYDLELYEFAEKLFESSLSRG